MKTRTTFIAIILVGTFFKATAQQGMRLSYNLCVGVTPYGYTQSWVEKFKDFKYNYKPVIGGNIGLEIQRNGVIFLTEMAFSHASFDNYNLIQNYTFYEFNPAKTSDFLNGTLTQYLGWTFNKNKRIQFPVYAGLGGGYVKGGALHNFTFDVAAKIRAKFYITNRFGCYVGVTGRYGFGSFQDVNPMYSYTNSDIYTHSLGNLMVTTDAGLIFNL